MFGFGESCCGCQANCGCLSWYDLMGLLIKQSNFYVRCTCGNSASAWELRCTHISGGPEISIVVGFKRI
jgi:hypothetical protein